jgi:cytochrome c biogenesis protein CcmG/thiol:disulfide interchange protein DsbE
MVQFKEYKMKKLTTLLTSLTFVLLALVAINNAVNASAGDNAPDFALTDLDGKSLSLADYKGKVVFLNFWATWCPPCRQEIPGFVEVYNAYKDEGLVILGVAVSDRENKVKDFVDKNDVSYPCAMGTNQIVRDYEPGNAIPATIVIDRQGKIYDKHVGYMDKSQVEKIFKELSK